MQLPTVARRRLHSPLWILAAALLAPFLPMLLAPASRVIGCPSCDNPDMFYYINAFAGACWRGGSVPLWNPHIMLGQPFLGEGQAALFHPLSWLFIALPTGAAINWLIALCVLLNGLAFYGYLRALRLSPAAAACGALAWAFSSATVSRIYAGHLTILFQLAAMPLMLMFWERHRQSGSMRPLLGLSLAYALMILAAYPQLLYIFSLFFLCYVLIQSALAATQGRAAAINEIKTILRLGAFVLLGIGIGAVQLLPTADFAGQSFRSQATIDFCGAYSLPPENLATLFIPRFFGYSLDSGPGHYWGRFNFWEMTAYIGLLPLLLAGAGFFAAPRPRRIALAACALIFLVLALGSFTPLFPFIYKFVPFFKLFRGPSKNILITQLCLATFAAYGLEALLRPAGGASRRLKPALGAAAALLVLALAFYAYILPHPETAGSHWRSFYAWLMGDQAQTFSAPDFAAMARWVRGELLRTGLFLALALGLLALACKGKWPRTHAPLAFALILADLALVFQPLLVTYNESRVREKGELLEPFRGGVYPQRVIAPSFTPNLPMLYGVSSPSGYVGASLMRYSNFINAVKGLELDTEQVLNPVEGYTPQMTFWAVDALILHKAMLTPGMPLAATSGELGLVRLPQPFPRACLGAAPRACANEQEALKYVLASGPALRERPAVERGSVPPPPPAPLAPQEVAMITAFSPNRVELQVRAAQPRVLVLAEAYEKNWKAKVNGEAAPVFPANHLFRGVIVPAGVSRVVFAYQPAAFRWGALLTLLSLGGALALGLRLRREQSKAPAEELREEPTPGRQPSEAAAPPADMPQADMSSARRKKNTAQRRTR